MESIAKFCDTMNKFFDVILHPVTSMQGISYGLCLLGATLSIIFGIAGFTKFYKWAVGFFLFYFLINYMF